MTPREARLQLRCLKARRIPGIVSRGNVTGWVRLKAALLGYFKPADYAYKTRQALSKWTQKGGITEYIFRFYVRFTQCSDIDGAEALF